MQISWNIMIDSWDRFMIGQGCVSERPRYSSSIASAQTLSPNALDSMIMFNFAANFYICSIFCLQDAEGLAFHYWALFDGHAGSGAAVVASRLLQHHIACQLQAVIEILRNQGCPPPTLAGGRAWYQPLPPGKHPRPSPVPDPGRFVAWGRGGARFSIQHPAPASLLHREEDPTREPGDRSHRERIQRDGERRAECHDVSTPLIPISPERFHTPWKSPCHYYLIFCILDDALMQRNVVRGYRKLLIIL